MNHKARNVLLKCVAALAISSVISWGLIDSANHRVRVAAQEVERQRISTLWDTEVERGKQEVEKKRREEEAARLAKEEADRKAAEEAEAARLAEEEKKKAEEQAKSIGVAKSDVVYGSRLGKVQVDGTNVNCNLYWGDSDTQFRYGAGCHAEDGCVLPGESGTVFIGGHTGTVFADLGSCQIGNIIHLTTSWGTFDYQITETRVINETDIDLCRFGATEPSCILYTCYPFGILVHTTQRYAVYADLVSSTLYDTANSVA